jgi:hypothetical protein
MTNKDHHHVSTGESDGPNTHDMSVQTMAEAPREWLSVPMIAEHYPALGKSMARTIVAERRIPVFRVGGRRLVVRRSDLESYIESGRV